MLKPKKQQDYQDQQAQSSQMQDEQHQQQQHSSSSNKPDVPPKLPPTHPLATGQHSDSQAAVPLAGAGAATTPDTASSSIANAVNEQYHKSADDQAPVSPVGAPAPISKDHRTVSEPVSAMSADEDKPLPIPKTETETETSAVTAGSADETETTGMQFTLQPKYKQRQTALTQPPKQLPSHRKPQPKCLNPPPARTSNPTAPRLPPRPPLPLPPPHRRTPKPSPPKSPPSQAAPPPPLSSTRKCL